MNPNVFMSYSRREVSFVNYLVDDLEDHGFNVWLDYRSLIPGTPWAEQIDQGLMEAEVILLVVSKAAIASQYVEMEWRRVLGEGKRVILVIFEAVDLPPELKAFEWVDFRGSYKKGLEELVRQLQTPEVEEHPVPETGFKVPAMVWAAAALSLVVGLFSLGAIWTLFIPYLLIPLPYRVFKRDFNFQQVQAALVMLPFAMFLTTVFVESDEAFDVISDLLMVSVPFVIALFFVLRSAGVQRWGKPVATLPKFANPYNPNNPHPKPVSFYVDHASEDRRVAQDLSATLEKYGHPQAAEPGQAEAVFAVVSRFKTSTAANPQKQVVYPVIVQNAGEVDEKLQKVQWIDFQHGVRNLDALAQLLPEPAKLLKALGIRPMGNQMVLPPVIQYLVYFLIALAIFTVGSWLPYIIQFLPDIAEYSDADAALVMLVINLIVFAAICVFMVWAIARRQPIWASLGMLGLGGLLLGLLLFWQSSIDMDVMDAFVAVDDLDDYRGMSSLFPPLLYAGGGILMVLLMIWKRADVRRWFPARVKKSNA